MAGVGVYCTMCVRLLTSCEYHITLNQPSVTNGKSKKQRCCPLVTSFHRLSKYSALAVAVRGRTNTTEAQKHRTTTSPNESHDQGERPHVSGPGPPAGLAAWLPRVRQALGGQARPARAERQPQRRWLPPGVTTFGRTCPPCPPAPGDALSPAPFHAAPTHSPTSPLRPCICCCRV